jgi:fatty-acyl-CoA synthase
MLRNHFDTLVEALVSAPPEKLFITMWRDDDDIDEVTFGDFLRMAKAQAADFHARGVQPGEKIILILPQGISLMAAFAGAMLCGAAPAILAYPNFKVDPMKYGAGLAGVSANLRARIVVVDEDFPAEWASCLAVGPGTQLMRSAALSISSTEPLLPQNQVAPGDLAFIQHSAGTTGLQKGVALSHCAVLTQLGHLADVLRLTGEDRVYSWLPLYHDMGLIACFMLPLAYHLPVVMQSPSDWVLRPGTMLKLISDRRCTLAWVPNFAFQFLARRVRPEDRLAFDLSSLRAIVNCSEPVRARSMDEFEAAYVSCNLKPEALQSSYAMAENVFAVTQSEIGRRPRRIWVDIKKLLENHQALRVSENDDGAFCFVSSGRCLPGNRTRIVSAEGRPLPDGEVGEILVHSDSLFRGYFNRPDLSEKALRQNWYWSGDLGFCLDGELYVIGRKNDLIITAGKNIYPQDVEEIVCSHPAIHDGRAVVFGLHNPDLGTEEIIVVAEVERNEDLEKALEIEQAVRGAIVAELGITVRAICLKPPRWIVKSTAGKPARSTTREKLLIEHPELLGSGNGEYRKVGAFRAREPAPVATSAELTAVPLQEHEHALEFVNDSVITRTIEGRIHFWNRRAEELYGWRKEEAIGKVSHDLLQTQFPKPLQEIDSELVKNGTWEGKLVHTGRDGGRVVVETRWTLDPRAAAVIEINRRSTDV